MDMVGTEVLIPTYCSRCLCNSRAVAEVDSVSNCDHFTCVVQCKYSVHVSI
jgi:hypothetical protein